MMMMMITWWLHDHGSGRPTNLRVRRTAPGEKSGWRNDLRGATSSGRWSLTSYVTKMMTMAIHLWYVFMLIWNEHPVDHHFAIFCCTGCDRNDDTKSLVTTIMAKRYLDDDYMMIVMITWWFWLIHDDCDDYMMISWWSHDDCDDDKLYPVTPTPVDTRAQRLWALLRQGSVKQVDTINNKNKKKIYMIIMLEIMSSSAKPHPTPLI